MSYILDALKRADAERQRGAVPGLHVQQVGLPSQGALNAGGAPWRWFAGAGLLLGAAWLAHLSLGTPDPLPAAVVPAAPTAPNAPMPVAEVIAPHTVRPVPEPTPTATSTAPVKTKAASAPNPAPKPAQAASKMPASPSSPTPVPKLSELPEGLRRQIPALAINGSVYSDNPAQRMLVVNGLVQVQGGQISPELKLEEIGVNNSVFSYSGIRFTVPH